MHIDRLKTSSSGASEARHFAEFFKMLADALDQHPKGLPDKALQRVFDRHQAYLALKQRGQLHCEVDHLEAGSQKTFGSRQLRLRLVSESRSLSEIP